MKAINLVKKFLSWLVKKIAMKCPDCNGTLNCEMMDSELNKLVYRCSKCGKQWI